MCVLRKRPVVAIRNEVGQRPPEVVEEPRRRFRVPHHVPGKHGQVRRQLVAPQLTETRSGIRGVQFTGPSSQLSVCMYFSERPTSGPASSSIGATTALPVILERRRLEIVDGPAVPAFAMRRDPRAGKRVPKPHDAPLLPGAPPTEAAPRLSSDDVISSTPSARPTASAPPPAAADVQQMARVSRNESRPGTRKYAFGRTPDPRDELRVTRRQWNRQHSHVHVVPGNRPRP